MIMITPAEFEDQMRKIKLTGDTELGHRAADDLMCEVLEENGYSSGVKIFKDLSKWYS